MRKSSTEVGDKPGHRGILQLGEESISGGSKDRNQLCHLQLKGKM